MLINARVPEATNSQFLQGTEGGHLLQNCQILWCCIVMEVWQSITFCLFQFGHVFKLEATIQCFDINAKKNSRIDLTKSCPNCLWAAVLVWSGTLCSWSTSLKNTYAVGRKSGLGSSSAVHSNFLRCQREFLRGTCYRRSMSAKDKII